MTYRDLYFLLKDKKSEYFPESVINHFLCDFYNVSNDDLLLHFDDEIPYKENLDNVINRILSGEPIQYVLNKASFLGVNLYVDNNVLIPRQETEQLVLDTVKVINKRFKNYKNIRILDIGCGSGNIGVLLGKLVKNSEISAIDISPKAVEICSKNASDNNVKINTYCFDVFTDELKKLGKFDLIISNPPYIKSKDTVADNVFKYEPHLALFASPQTSYYERIIELSKTMLNDNGFIAFEIDSDMQEVLEDSIKQHCNYNYEFNKDLYNNLRYLYLYKNTMDYKLIAEKLLNHQVVAFPTDTVMGLGVIFDDEVAYENLCEVKHRPKDKPYTLMVGDKSEISKYAIIDKKVSKVIDKLLPGPLTMLLKSKDNVPGFVTHDTGIIGIRVAPTETIKNIINAAEKPLLVPSANVSGEKPALNSEEVKSIFKDTLGYIVEGNAVLGKPSTIVDLTSDCPKIIREGDISLSQITKAMEE